MHEILHTMSEGNTGWFCWIIIIYYQYHGNILKIIASLKCDVNDTANPVI